MEKIFRRTQISRDLERSAVPTHILVPRYRQPMRVQVIPKALAVLLVIRYIVDLVIIMVILDPFSAPKTVDDVLRLGGGKEDCCVLVDGRFEAIKGEMSDKMAHGKGRSLRGDRGRNIAVFFSVPVSRAHNALQTVDGETVDDPSSEDLTGDGFGET